MLEIKPTRASSFTCLIWIQSYSSISRKKTTIANYKKLSPALSLSPDDLLKIVNFIRDALQGLQLTPGGAVLKNYKKLYESLQSVHKVRITFLSNLSRPYIKLYLNSIL